LLSNEYFLTAIASIISAIIAGIPAYRAGILKNKSLESETIERIHSIANNQLDRYSAQLKACISEREALSTQSKKWELAFIIVKAEMRIGRKKSELTYQTVEASTIAKLRDIRDKISTSYD